MKVATMPCVRVSPMPNEAVSSAQGGLFVTYTDRDGTPSPISWLVMARLLSNARTSRGGAVVLRQGCPRQETREKSAVNACENMLLIPLKKGKRNGRESAGRKLPTFF